MQIPGDSDLLSCMPSIMRFCADAFQYLFWLYAIRGLFCCDVALLLCHASSTSEMMEEIGVFHCELTCTDLLELF